MRTDYIEQGDCLELMKSIPDKSIDFICCDLPYGTVACEWDAIIPFDKLWEAYNRILKQDGVVALFATEPFAAKLLLSNEADFREEIIWLKNKGGSGFGIDHRHMKIHEKILVFSKTAKHTFNPQKWLIAEKEFITQRKTFTEVEVGNNVYGKIRRTRKVDTGERNPLSIVSCRVPFTPQKAVNYSVGIDLRYHPTQKPLDLVEYLIKTYSNVGDVVLDNCMGSGTTCVASVRTSRKYIGFEKEKEYFDIAKKRIEKEQNDGEQTSFFLRKEQFSGEMKKNETASQERSHYETAKV